MKEKVGIVKSVENFITFIDFTTFPIGGMLLINGREEFDMVNVTAMTYISKVKLAFNVREDVIKLYFGDNSTELIVMNNYTEITINGVSIKSRKTFSDFADMVKNGVFNSINRKYN